MSLLDQFESERKYSRALARMLPGADAAARDLVLQDLLWKACMAELLSDESGPWGRSEKKAKKKRLEAALAALSEGKSPDQLKGLWHEARRVHNELEPALVRAYGLDQGRGRKDVWRSERSPDGAHARLKPFFSILNRRVIITLIGEFARDQVRSRLSKFRLAK
jgi:hypothetical protein